MRPKAFSRFASKGEIAWKDLYHHVGPAGSQTLKMISNFKQEASNAAPDSVAVGCPVELNFGPLPAMAHARNKCRRRPVQSAASLLVVVNKDPAGDCIDSISEPQRKIYDPFPKAPPEGNL
tara:strand:- start:116 stop:478 length:363 start_codon:yes stop_codon:yes gene_type:complete